MTGSQDARSAGGPPTPDAARRVFRRALRDVLAFSVVLAAVGAGLGALVADDAGAWGGALGGAVTLLVAGTTVATMLLTARVPVATAGAIALAAWVVKAGVLLVAFIALRESELVHRPTFGIVVVLGVLGSLVIDYRAVSLGRVPYVDPTQGAARPDEPHD